MFDPPPRPFRRGGFVWGPGSEGRRFLGNFRFRSRRRDRVIALYPKTGHDIETRSAYASRFGGSASEPGPRPPSQSVLFSSIHRFRSAARALGGSRFDLNEYQQWSTPRYQIHLDAVCTNVPCNDAISSRLEEATGNDFASLTETLARIRHLHAPAMDRFNRVSIFLGSGNVLDILMGVDLSSGLGRGLGIDIGVVAHLVENSRKLQRRAG